MKAFDDVLNYGLSVPTDKLPEFFGEWERVRVAVNMRLLASATAPAPEADHRIGAKQAAKLLGVSAKTVYRRKTQYPFYRPENGQVLFSFEGLQQWIAAGREVK